MSRTASSDLTDTVEVVNKKKIYKKYKTKVRIFIKIFEKMWEMSLSVCLNIPLYPQVLSVKVVINTH